MENKNKNKVPFYKKNKFKFSTMSTVIIAVFMICLVAVNILASFLSDRITGFSIDMTSSSDYTISDENVEYIKKIDKPITVIVTCTEDYYLSDYYSSISQYYTDSSNGKYFYQTIELLKNYEKINDKIDVKFIDATTPTYNNYSDRYTGADINIVDIIDDYTYTNDDWETKTKYKVLGFDDLYEISENSSTSTSYTTYGTISGSSVETSVTSALYYVVKEQTDKIAVITDYGTADVSDYLKTLELSGYDYVTISDLSVEEIPEDATMLMLAAPTLDLSEADVKKIDEFLLGKAGDKDFKYNRTLIYFSYHTQVDTPNIDGLLEEWRITFDSGTVYETDDKKYFANSNTSILLEDASSGYLDSVNTNYQYCTNNARPMKIKFEQSGKFNTYEIIKTSDTCVTRPYKGADNWSANDANKSSYSSVVLSRYATKDTENENSARFSNVLAISSFDFINSEYLRLSDVGNDEAMLELLNTCANRVTETYEIKSKQINSTVFMPTEIQAKMISIVCIFIIPILTVVIGVVFYILRKRR